MNILDDFGGILIFLHFLGQPVNPNHSCHWLSILIYLCVYTHHHHIQIISNTSPFWLLVSASCDLMWPGSQPGRSRRRMRRCSCANWTLQCLDTTDLNRGSIGGWYARSGDGKSWKVTKFLHGHSVFIGFKMGKVSVAWNETNYRIASLNIFVHLTKSTYMKAMFDQY